MTMLRNNFRKKISIISENRFKSGKIFRNLRISFQNRKILISDRKSLRRKVEEQNTQMKNEVAAMKQQVEELKAELDDPLGGSFTGRYEIMRLQWF